MEEGSQRLGQSDSILGGLSVALLALTMEGTHVKECGKLAEVKNSDRRDPAVLLPAPFTS